MFKFLKKTPEVTETVQETVESQYSDELQEKVLKSVKPNRKVIAEAIFSGMSQEDLEERFDKYTVEDMRRFISKTDGNPWECLGCHG